MLVGFEYVYVGSLLCEIDMHASAALFIPVAGSLVL